MPAGVAGGVEVTRAEELRDEADALRKRADILVRVAEVIETVHAACDSGTCPNGRCQDCPAHVGQPGICLFVRLRSVVDDYEARPVKSSEPSEIIEVD